MISALLSLGRRIEERMISFDMEHLEVCRKFVHAFMW
jgi:hypothetical protein